MAEFKEQVLDILEEVCENDIVKENLDVQLFEEGILDSFAVVSLLVEFQERLDIEVSISDFDRDEWATPNMVIKSWKKSDEQSKIWSMLLALVLLLYSYLFQRASYFHF